MRQKKIVAAETLLITKQQNQMNALKKKCDGQMNEERSSRQIEQDKMLQRYQNVKKELESQQSLERIKMEKLFGKQMLAAKSSLSYGQQKALDGYSTKAFTST